MESNKSLKKQHGDNWEDLFPLCLKAAISNFSKKRLFTSLYGMKQIILKKQTFFYPHCKEFVIFFVL